MGVAMRVMMVMMGFGVREIIMNVNYVADRSQVFWSHEITSYLYMLDERSYHSQ